MATALYSHPDCLAHEMGADHPESPQRLGAISDLLIATGLDLALALRDAPQAKDEDLRLAHEALYIAELRSLLSEVETSGLRRALDADTVARPGTLAARCGRSNVPACAAVVCMGTVAQRFA